MNFCAFCALTLLGGIWPVKTAWWSAGVVICLRWGADLHMAQLMPLILTVSCSSKSRLVLPFWYRLTRVVPDSCYTGVVVVLCTRGEQCTYLKELSLHSVSHWPAHGGSNGHAKQPIYIRYRCTAASTLSFVLLTLWSLAAALAP